MEQFLKFCWAHQSPCSHFGCQYFFSINPSHKVIFGINQLHYTNFRSFFLFCFFPLRFHQPACQSCNCSIIQNYISFSLSDRETTERPETWPWNWSGRQALTWLGMYILICSLSAAWREFEAHRWHSEGTRCKGMSVCSGKCVRERAHKANRDPVHSHTPVFIFTTFLLIPSTEGVGQRY